MWVYLYIHRYIEKYHICGLKVGCTLYVGAHFTWVFTVFYPPGRLPLTSPVCLVTEEDTYASYSRLMLKYYLAEGIMSQHRVLVASADPSPEQLIQVTRSSVRHCVLIPALSSSYR